MVLEGLELGLGKGVVVTDLGPAERLSESQIGEQLSRALGGHRGAPIAVQGEHLRFDVVLAAGLLDEATGEIGVLAGREHPADDVAAEDVEQDVEVVVAPLLRDPATG